MRTRPKTVRDAFATLVEPELRLARRNPIWDPDVTVPDAARGSSAAFQQPARVFIPPLVMQLSALLAEDSR